MGKLYDKLVAGVPSGKFSQCRKRVDVLWTVSVASGQVDVCKQCKNTMGGKGRPR